MSASKPTHPLVKLLYAGCGLVLLANLGLRFFTHAYDHAHFSFETWPAFVSLFGFAGFCALVFGAKILRLLVKRPEDYYDDRRPVDGVQGGEAGGRGGRS